MVRCAKVFALVDCNNFFVSCERVFRPDLWNKPVAVLSCNDGCIVARSNEVKQIGIPMGAPLFKVKDIVAANNVTLFSGNFALYGDFSQRVVQILQSACPHVEVYSVDESFLEISTLNIDNYHDWAARLRADILQWTGIPVSIGVASTKTLAKAAAEFAKKTFLPDGVHVLCSDRQITPAEAKKRHDDLLNWLPIEDIWGVGRRLAPVLRQKGISTAQHLTEVSDKWAQQQLSITGARTVCELRGESCISMTKQEPQKTIASTRSFGHTVRNYYELEGAIATYAAQAAAKLRNQNSVVSAILVFLRTSKKYDKKYGASIVVRMQQPSADTGAIIGAALSGLASIYDKDLAYKKGGIVLLDLVPATAWQMSLLDQNPSKIDQQVALMSAVDALNQKYGVRLVQHASEQIAQKSWQSKSQLKSPAYTTSWHALPKVG